MLKKKLSLSDIKVKSFITSIDESDRGTIAGGAGRSDNPACLTAVAACNAGHSNNPFCPPPFSCGRPDSLCPPPLDTELQCI